MNTAIFHREVQKYIQQHLGSDVPKLILKGSPFPDISVQELANQIIAKQRSKDKLPTWFHTENIYYPDKISIEQSSSEITAAYKSGIITGNSLIDITGGFGVDAYFFARHFKNVIHCELNKALSHIVAYNYEQLGISNIKTFTGNGIDFIKKATEKFDCIYIDPSRRNDIKGKVFLLKDCEPDVPANLDELFKKSNTILLKSSPMLDIKGAVTALRFVREVHVVAVQNEVKELLFLLENSYEKEIQVKTINYEKTHTQEFHFSLFDTVEPYYGIPKPYLYEPNAAILKSGGFNEISVRYQLKKIHQHSHIYTSDKLIEKFPGRTFKIENIFPYGKNLGKKLLFSKANITTRNFPRSVAQLRKDLKLKDGGANYLFFTTGPENNLLVINCVKILLKH